MVFNKEILFLHPVKTAGITLTNFFLSRLKAPMFYVVQKGHHGMYVNWSEVVCLIGNRHGNLPYARDYLKCFLNFPIESFKSIISVVRNPYAMELSRFFYFAQDMDWIDPNSKEVLLARQGDFETFAKEAPYNYCSESGFSEIQHYFQIDGKLPNNLSILRCEFLEQDLKSVFVKNRIKMDRIRGVRNIPKRDTIKNPIGGIRDALSILGLHQPYRLPRLNPTKKKDSPQKLLTPEAERAIYNKYKWIFDNGYYERKTAASEISRPRAIPYTKCVFPVVKSPIKAVTITKGPSIHRTEHITSLPILDDPDPIAW